MITTPHHLIMCNECHWHNYIIVHLYPVATTLSPPGYFNSDCITSSYLELALCTISCL